MKGISDAQQAKEKLWTQDDLIGTIKEIRLMDGSNVPTTSDGENDKTPTYAEVTVEFDNGITARIPCTVAEAEEYTIGQSATVSLDTDSDE